MTPFRPPAFDVAPLSSAPDARFVPAPADGLLRIREGRRVAKGDLVVVGEAEDGSEGVLLAGNAVAVHDIEASMFGTTLGMTGTGQASTGGHGLYILRLFIEREQDARDRNPTNRDHASRAGKSPYPFLPIT